MSFLSNEEFEQIPESNWTPYEVTDDYIRSYTYVEIGGHQVRAERTQYLANDLLIAANQQEYNDSENKRWGDGKVVARLPLNIWFDQISEKDLEGDKDHLTYWLNDSENQKYRTFKGNV